jgi:hypothetical protein
VCRDDWDHATVFHEDDTEHIADFVTKCVQNKSVFSDAQRQLYLNSVNGSCTEKVFAAIDQTLIKIAGPTIAACTATCRGETVDPTPNGFHKCIQDLGESLTTYDPEFLNSQFQLQGQCSFEEYNHIQTIIRNFN